MSTEVKNHLLIDGDIICYKACSINETEVRWDEHNWVLSANYTAVKDYAKNNIKQLLDKFETTSYTIGFTGKENFRKKVLASYKENRKETRKPMLLYKIRDEMIGGKHGKLIEGIEADDMLGILSTDSSYHGDKRKIICSIDKDFKTIPGWLYNPDQGNLEEIPEADANYELFIQALTGDRTDNYLGLPGCGPVKAQKILDDAGGPGVPASRLWEATKEAYEKAGLTEKDALTQLRCARILRSEDWDKKKKEVILYTPEST